MKYFLDTEFHEYHKQTKCLGIKIGKPIPTIDLISIGIVSEDIEKTLMPPTDTYNETIKTNREYYAISKDFNIKDAWNSYQLEINKLYPLGPKNNKVYWLRNNVLKLIFNELLDADIHYIKVTKSNTAFNLKNFTRLINKYGKTNKQIAKEILYFTSNHYFDKTGFDLKEAKKYNLYDEFKPEFYAYYADYDWVVFCQLFGKMIDLPKGFPMYCNDLKQIMYEKKLSNKWKEENVVTNKNEHNALVDAKWNLKLFNKLKLKNA